MAHIPSPMLLDNTGGTRDRIVGFETEYGFCLQDPKTGKFYDMGEHCYSFGMPQGTDQYDDETGNRMYMDIGPHPELSTAEEISFRGAADRLILGHLAMAKFWKENPAKVRQGTDNKPKLTRVHLLANNVDSLNETWGCHENFLVSRGLQPEDFIPGMAVHNLSRIVWAGNGAVRPYGRKPQFVLSERADHIWNVDHSGTTGARPLVNLKDEPLAGADEYRRIHIISGDSVISPFANALKLASGSILLRACEIGVDFSDLLPANPPEAMKIISHDPTLNAKVRLEDGRKFTGLDLQAAVIERSEPELRRRSYLTSQEEGYLERWKKVIDDLGVDPIRCLNRVDWVLKQDLIERQLADVDTAEKNPAQVAKALAFDFHRLLPNEGVGMKLLRKGFYEDSPPKDVLENGLPLPETRAKLRVKLLKRARATGLLSGASWEVLKLSSYYNNATLKMYDPFLMEDIELDEKIDRLIAFDSLMEIAKAG